MGYSIKIKINDRILMAINAIGEQGIPLLKKDGTSFCWKFKILKYPNSKSEEYFIDIGDDQSYTAVAIADCGLMCIDRNVAVIEILECSLKELYVDTFLCLRNSSCSGGTAVFVDIIPDETVRVACCHGEVMNKRKTVLTTLAKPIVAIKKCLDRFTVRVDVKDVINPKTIMIKLDDTTTRILSRMFASGIQYSICEDLLTRIVRMNSNHASIKTLTCIQEILKYKSPFDVTDEDTYVMKISSGYTFKYILPNDVMCIDFFYDDDCNSYLRFTCVADLSMFSVMNEELCKRNDFVNAGNIMHPIMKCLLEHGIDIEYISILKSD